MSLDIIHLAAAYRGVQTALSKRTVALEVAGVLRILHKEIRNCNLKRNGKRPLPGGGGHHDEVETVIIQALAALQDTQDFGDAISKTNDYKQALGNFTVLFGLTNLLRRLLGFSHHNMGMLFL